MESLLNILEQLKNPAVFFPVVAACAAVTALVLATVPMRMSRRLLAAGLGFGALTVLLGAIMPGGVANWFLHSPAGRLGVPISLALLAAGAVVGRMERTDAMAQALPATGTAEANAALNAGMGDSSYAHPDRDKVRSTQ